MINLKSVFAAALVVGFFSVFLVSDSNGQRIADFTDSKRHIGSIEVLGTALEELIDKDEKLSLIHI